MRHTSGVSYCVPTVTKKQEMEVNWVHFLSLQIGEKYVHYSLTDLVYCGITCSFTDHNQYICLYVFNQYQLNF